MLGLLDFSERYSGSRVLAKLVEILRAKMDVAFLPQSTVFMPCDFN